jgi:hypothetical protein
LEVIGGEKEKQLKAAQLRTEMAVENAFQDACKGDFDELESHMMLSNRVVREDFDGYVLERAVRAAPMMRSKAGGGRRLMKAAPPMTLFGSRAPAFAAAPASTGLFGAPVINRLCLQSPAAVEREIQANTVVTSDKVTTTANTQLPHSVDFTMVPQILDAAVEQSGKDTSLRSTVLKTGDTWVRNRQENLLTGLKRQQLNCDDIKTEKNKAFDLLDALSRSGSLPIQHSELHVMVAVTHCFEKDVIDTIVCDNVDPIEKIEMSTLLFASTMHGVPARALIKDNEELLRLEGSLSLLEHQGSDQETST